MPASHKHMVLDMFAAKRLAELCEASRAGVPCKDDLADVLVRCKRASLEGVLTELKHGSLKELCCVFGLDAAGRKKAPLVARILNRFQGPPVQPELPGIRASDARPGMGALFAGGSPAPSRPKPRRATAASTSGQSALEGGVAHYVRVALDLLRATRVSGSHEFHVLVLLFYKRLCDAQEEFDARAKGDPKPDRGRRTCQLHVLEGATLAHVARLPADLGAALDANLRAIEAHNPSLQGVFQEAKFVEKHRFPDALLRGLLAHLATRRLHPSEVETGILGEVVEGLIEAHYDGLRGGSRGEHFTPRAVAQLIVALVEPRPGLAIYDPTCGTGELLLQAARSLAHAGVDVRRVALIGDEPSRIRWSMAKMLLAVYETEHVGIEIRNPLEAPRFIENGASSLALPQYDVVLGNPPFSVGAWGHDVWCKGDPFGRDMYGCPSRTSSEFAFVQHMLASLQRTGRMAVVMPHGVLFRSAEAKIREELLHDDLLEAVIGLGPKLFKGTNIAVAVLFFRPDKPHDRKRKVLIVDGSDEFVREGPRNVLTGEHVDRLVDAVQRFRTEAGFCRVVGFAELREKKFDLSIGNYVDDDASLAREGHRAETARLDTLIAARDATVARTAIHVAGSRPTLAALDDEVRAVHAVLAQLRSSRRLRVYQILTRGTSGAGQPNDEVVELPRGWTLCELGEILSEKPRGGVSKPRNAVGEEVVYIGQTALHADGFVHFEHHPRIRLGEIELSRSSLMPGDVLMVRVHATSEGCGRAALVPHLVEPVVYQSSMVRLRANSAEMEPLILLHWLYHPPIRHLLTSMARGSLQRYIRQSDLLSLPCPVIPLHERAAIASELRDLDEAIVSEVTRLAQVEARRDRLSLDLT